MAHNSIVLLHGCKKNIGDFLIHDRSKSLIQTALPQYDIIELKSWEPLDSHVEKINSAKALVIGGGPGIQEDMYPSTYPLVKILDDIKTPIVTLGVGWKGVPGDSLTIYRDYTISSQSIALLQKMKAIGVRDIYTSRTLKRMGISNVSFNGCPVWYDQRYIGKRMDIPKKISQIVITPSQNALFHGQSVDLVKEVRSLFPQATIYVSFHRGIEPDKYTSQSESTNIKKMVSEMKQYNVIIKDTSYNLENIAFYEECDIHLGYRLHAHIDFLSMRKPSFLLHEDGRGNGFSDTIGLPGINAWTRRFGSSKVANTSVLPKNLLMTINPFAVSEAIDYLNEEIETGFLRFHGIPQKIDSMYEKMNSFIKEQVG